MEVKHIYVSDLQRSDVFTLLVKMKQFFPEVSVAKKKRGGVRSLFVFLPYEKRGINAGLNLQAVLEVKREHCLFLPLRETRDKRGNEQIKTNTAGTVTVAE